MIELFRGTLNAAQVHPREVVKESLRHNAAAVILAHNHPSGVAEPSSADELITQGVKDALALIDIQVLDHVLGGILSVTVGTNLPEFPANSGKTIETTRNNAALTHSTG